MLFMTVPTAGQHAQLLVDLVNSCGLPPQQVVIVATKPDLSLPAGVVIVEDLGPLNIQRWWNVGIEEAQRRGAGVGAGLHDDVRIAIQREKTMKEWPRAWKITLIETDDPDRTDLYEVLNN